MKCPHCGRETKDIAGHCQLCYGLLPKSPPKAPPASPNARNAAPYAGAGLTPSPTPPASSYQDPRLGVPLKGDGTNASVTPSPYPSPNYYPPTFRERHRRGLTVLLLALCAVIVASALVFSGAESRASRMRDQRMQALVERFNETESYPERLRLFSRMARLDGLDAGEYIAASRNLEAAYFQLGLLCVGYENTGDPRMFREMERLRPVKGMVNHQDSWRNIYEVIFDKSLDRITWEDMYRIKYFYQRSRDGIVTYSLESPFDYGSWSDFEKTCTTVSYRHTERAYFNGYTALIGCQYLDSNVGIIPGDIIGKPYRRLSVVAYQDRTQQQSRAHMADIGHFSVAPQLRELTVTGQYLRSGDTSLLTELETLYARNWEPVGPVRSAPTAMDLEQLLHAPVLEELTLENSSVSTASLPEGIWLRSLRLVDCVVEDTRGIETIQGLLSLTVENCSVKQLDFVTAFADLEHLRLSGNSAAPSIVPLGALNRLQTLALDGTVALDSFLGSRDTITSLTVGRAADLPQLAGFDALTSLTLSGSGQSYDLNQLPGLPQLQSLRVAPEGDSSANRLTGLERLAASPALRALWVENVGAISGLDQLCAADLLEEITLHHMGFSGSEATFSGCSSLRSLRLTNIRLDNDYGAAVFRGVGTLEGLITLDVSRTMIDSLDFLADMTGLEALTATDNYIDDASVLFSLPNLHTVDLEDNLIPEAQLEQIRRTFSR